MNVRILAVHPADAFHVIRDELIGVEGRAWGFVMTGHEWYAFDFVPNGLRTPIYLQFANFEILK